MVSQPQSLALSEDQYQIDRHGNSEAPAQAVMFLQVLDLSRATVEPDQFPAYLSGLSRATALTELDLSEIGLDIGPEPFKLPPNIVKVNLAGAHSLASRRLLTQTWAPGKAKLTPPLRTYARSTLCMVQPASSASRKSPCCHAL